MKQEEVLKKQREIMERVSKKKNKIDPEDLWAAGLGTIWLALGVGGAVLGNHLVPEGSGKLAHFAASAAGFIGGLYIPYKIMDICDRISIKDTWEKWKEETNDSFKKGDSIHVKTMTQLEYDKGQMFYSILFGGITGTIAIATGIDMISNANFGIGKLATFAATGLFALRCAQMEISRIGKMLSSDYKPDEIGFIC